MTQTRKTVFPAIGSLWINNKTQRQYKVLYAGAHTETGEALVVYQGVGENAPADPGDAWCRPVEMWDEKFTPLT